MSAAVSTLSIEELLNSVRPYRYFAVWREGDRVEYATVDPGEALLVLPGMNIRAFSVTAKPLNVQPPRDVASHPRVRWLAEVVGYPPALGMFQYTFVKVRLRLLQRLESGAELYMVTQEPDVSPPITLHTVNAYYVVYRSNSGRLYSEVKGGIRAYQLVERGQLKPPQVYVYRRDKHRREIGVRIPLDLEQVRQLISYLTGP
jgi:hypothetical protein